MDPLYLQTQGHARIVAEWPMVKHLRPPRFLPFSPQPLMQHTRPHRWPLQALNVLTLLLFALQALALHAPCLCSHCALVVPEAVEPSDATAHSCCHHQQLEEAPPGPMLQAHDCACGDHDAHLLAIPQLKRPHAQGLAGAVTVLNLLQSHSDLRPRAPLHLTWQRSTGPPGTQQPPFLRFHALLI